MDDQRVKTRPPLRAINSRNRCAIGCVGTEPVNGFCWKCDKAARAQKGTGFDETLFIRQNLARYGRSHRFDQNVVCVALPVRRAKSHPRLSKRNRLI